MKELIKEGKFMNKNKKEIPIFFATDDNYAPFLAVSIHSMLQNASKNYNYTIKILNSGISSDNIEKISKYNSENVDIEFVDVKASLKNLAEELHITSEQYTLTTYYRLFIPNLYPQYDKAVYLDSDIVVRGDISKFYNINIGDRLVGAVTDEFVMSSPNLYEYITKCLGLENVSDYFNAGVLLMNLDQFRKQDFFGKFNELLNKYKFPVQDQDYLNVICQGQVYYISNMWDQMPTGENYDVNKVQLIHYNLIWKPWHTEVMYGEEFWKYSDQTEYKDIIRNMRKDFTEEMYAKDVAGFNSFMSVIEQDGVNPNNYYYTYIHKKHDDGESDPSFAFRTAPAKV